MSDILPAPGLVPQTSGLLWRWFSTRASIILLIFPTVFLFFQSFGFTLLARSTYHWQLSFVQAEQMLLEQLDEDGGCRRKCLQAMRQMKEDVWCPGERPVITSHHLQTVLFWTCEKHPHSHDWQVFSKGFLRLVRKLHKCVSQHFLKHFFVPKSNLFRYANAGELDAVAQKLALFLKDPQMDLP